MSQREDSGTDFEDEPPDDLRFVSHFTHEGKRADKVKVDYDLMNNEREVSEYTMTCPECDGEGRYDQRGDVICEDCGYVIGGQAPMTVVAAGKKEAAENTRTNSGRSIS